MSDIQFPNHSDHLAHSCFYYLLREYEHVLPTAKLTLLRSSSLHNHHRCCSHHVLLLTKLQAYFQFIATMPLGCLLGAKSTSRTRSRSFWYGPYLFGGEARIEGDFTFKAGHNGATPIPSIGNSSSEMEFRRRVVPGGKRRARKPWHEPATFPFISSSLASRAPRHISSCMGSSRGYLFPH